ncbi:MAG: hypothetical protein K0U98_03685 [Deltaproteobacteria bacterium]|nr:hypothetical protein [Deltaproteobacteria bacterium]
MDLEDLLERIKQADRDGETRLVLGDQGITELPAEIGNLSRLEQLVLFGNQLTDLPAGLGRLTNLTRL